MRCEDLTRELAVPTGRFKQDEVSSHLRACPSCASWSDQAETLDRAWAATRPAEPTAEAFDSLWAAVLDAPAPIPIPTTRAFPTRRVFWAAVGLAQAAAILLLVATPWRQTPAPTELAESAPIPQPPVAVARVEIPVDQDATYVIRINDNGVEVDQVDMGGDLPPPMLASNLSRMNDTDALNSLESMAE